MSFSRLNYDDCSYKHALREAISPGDYMLGTPRVDCDGCFFASPGINLNSYGAAVCEKNLTDVDSEMMGINRKASKCPANKYLPSDKPFCNAKAPKECSFLTREDTRISNPPCTLRGTGWNRWEWLCKDPQEKALMPFDFLINNRLVVKDNHRPCVSDPIDQRDALPPPENDFVRYDWSSRYTEPFYDIVSPQLGTCESIKAL